MDEEPQISVDVTLWINYKYPKYGTFSWVNLFFHEILKPFGSKIHIAKIQTSKFKVLWNWYCTRNDSTTIDGKGCISLSFMNNSVWSKTFQSDEFNLLLPEKRWKRISWIINELCEEMLKFHHRSSFWVLMIIFTNFWLKQGSPSVISGFHE